MVNYWVGTDDSVSRSYNSQILSKVYSNEEKDWFLISILIIMLVTLFFLQGCRFELRPESECNDFNICKYEKPKRHTLIWILILLFIKCFTVDRNISETCISDVALKYSLGIQAFLGYFFRGNIRIIFLKFISYFKLNLI